MDPHSEWTPQEPPPGFADRVMAEVEGAAPSPLPRPGRVARGSWRVAGTALALGVAAGLALAIGTRWFARPARGEAIAADRTQVTMGGRAVAVLEPGARVKWDGDDVRQPAGDVFYRVEPGGAFLVHTPAGDVRVLGTCFRVKVEGVEEGAVNGRDVKAGAVGAAMAAAAIVSVYEGRVAVSQAKETVTITAGETARADDHGVRRALAEGTPAAEQPESALAAANENLVDQVSDYKRRLEAIAGQKDVVEKQLQDAQKKLALAQTDGQAGPQKNAFELSQDDWKDLAAKGEVRARTPCNPATDDKALMTAKDMRSLGLPDGDLQPINDAIQQSAARTWGVLRPLCAQALGGKPDIADVLGPESCQSVVFHGAQKQEDTTEELHQVAEIRAGERPMPKDMSSLGAVGQLVWAMTGESKTLEQDLARTIGPDDARAFVYADTGCWSSSTWSTGPRKPGTQVITGVQTDKSK